MSPIDKAVLLNALTKAAKDRKPTPVDLALYERRCIEASLTELGSMLFTAENDHYAEVAAKVARERLAQIGGAS